MQQEVKRLEVVNMVTYLQCVPQCSWIENIVLQH